MPVINRETAPSDARKHGTDASAAREIRLAAAGGLTQFGANFITLEPGASSSDRHWHEEEDEFLYMLGGAAILVDDDGEHDLAEGDAITWKAGVPNAHHIRNRSEKPCTFLVVGTRSENETCHYPDLGRAFTREGRYWSLTGPDGETLRKGEF